MLKKILLGASIVTATTKIVTDICEAYEEAEDKPKGLSIIPFVLQVLAKGGKDMAKNSFSTFRENVQNVRRDMDITKSQFTKMIIAGLTTGLTTGLAASSIVYVHYSNYNSKNNIQID